MSEIQKEIPLFVYGTLKRGGRLHDLLTEPHGCDQARYRGEAQVNGQLYRVRNAGFPAFRIAMTGVVHGELYEHISPVLMSLLDTVEGHPWHYRRTELKTTSGEPCWVYVYQLSVKDFEVIPDGKFDVSPSASVRKRLECQRDGREIRG